MGVGRLIVTGVDKASLSLTPRILPFSRYSSDMELEDAVHTAILTLKEGYEGAMSETSLEIGIATVEDVEITDVSVAGGIRKEKRGKFRKLTPGEVKDYLANIA